MSLSDISNLDHEGRCLAVLKELTAQFNGNYEDAQWEVWEDFIREQDPNVLTQAVNELVRAAHPNDWVPSLRQMSDFIGKIYKRKRIAEASSKSSLVCQECNGSTWKKTAEAEGFPCSQCLPEAFNRWRSGRYAPFGYLIDDSELEGPAADANYAEPTKPWRSSREAASAERAKQYVDFISSGNGHEEIEEFLTSQIEKANS